MKVGQFYHTYSESSWGERLVHSSVHKCIAVEGTKAVLVTLITTGFHDVRPFIVDISAWHHYVDVEES